jgi:uncharacterized membrane protein
VALASDASLDLARSAGLGFAAGLRSIMPLALLSAQLERDGPDIAGGGWTIDALVSPWGVLGLSLAACGEVIADKLPFVPSRVAPLPLAGRVALGGTAGALASLAGGQAADRGALAAALGALLGSLAGYTWRTRARRVLPLPSLALAAAEDAVAFGLARWAVQR